MHLEVAGTLVDDGGRWEGLERLSSTFLEGVRSVVLSERRSSLEIGRGTQERLSREGRLVAMSKIARVTSCGRDFHNLTTLSETTLQLIGLNFCKTASCKLDSFTHCHQIHLVS